MQNINNPLKANNGQTLNRAWYISSRIISDTQLKLKSTTIKAVSVKCTCVVRQIRNRMLLPVFPDKNVWETDSWSVQTPSVSNKTSDNGLFKLFNVRKLKNTDKWLLMITSIQVAISLVLRLLVTWRH